MKLKLLSGLTALQLLAAATTPAQTYTFTVGDANSYVRIADHIGGEDLGPWSAEHTLEAYNLNYSNKDLIGLIRFDGPTGTILFASHYWLPNSTDRIRLLKGYENSIKGSYIVAERVASDGSVKSAILLRYDYNTGQILNTYELPVLPSGYSFVRVFDVIETYASVIPKRILCTISIDGKHQIAELIYNSATGKYVVRHYKLDYEPKSFLAVHYVRAYHYGSSTIGEPAFYGLADDGDVHTAFCYYEDGFGGKVFDRYELTSINGEKGITGMQTNGNYGPTGAVNRIEMAFTDKEGGICMQQKDALVTTNWQRFWQFPDKQEFRLGWGRDGHGTKQGSPNLQKAMGYFLGAWMPDNEPNKSLVTALHYKGANGDLVKPRVYKITGLGIFEDGSFPSTSYDPGEYYSPQYYDNYTFIADRFEPRNGFHFGTGNSLIDTDEKFFCTEPIEIFEAKDKRLNTITTHPDVSISDSFEIEYPELEEYTGIEVSVTLDCPAEKNGQKMAAGNALLPGTSELRMDAQQLHIDATGKTIASFRVLTIDGRTIADLQGVNATSYEHQFPMLLRPGIYIVHIAYTDHTTEAKKVSIR